MTIAFNSKLTNYFNAKLQIFICDMKSITVYLSYNTPYAFCTINSSIFDLQCVNIYNSCDLSCPLFCILCYVLYFNLKGCFKYYLLTICRSQ